MGVCAGHGHEIKGLEGIDGKFCLYHSQDHLEEDLSKRDLDSELRPLVTTFLVQMHSHHGHEPGEPGMNKATGQVSLENESFLLGGETYTQT